MVDVKFDETEKQWTIEELNAGCSPAVVVKAMAKYENVRPNFCKKCVHCVVDSNTNLCSNLRVITDTGRMNYGSGKITWKGEGKEYAGDMAPCDYVNEEGKCREFRRKR